MPTFPVYVSEVMTKPSASKGQYIEIFNGALDKTFSPDGCVLEYTSDMGPQSVSITATTVMNVGDFFVLGNSDDSATNGGITVDFVYSQPIVFDQQGHGSFNITCSGPQIVDIRMNIDSSFPTPVMGTSIQYDGEFLNSMSPPEYEMGTAWCKSFIQQTNIFGTPGATNGFCSAAPTAGVIPTTMAPTVIETIAPTVAPTVAPIPNITPRVDCVMGTLDPNKFVAILGWSTEGVFNIPIGENNMLSRTIGNPSDQPTFFNSNPPFFPATGQFRAEFDGQETSWTLGRGIVTFIGNDPATTCIDDEVTIDAQTDQLVSSMTVLTQIGNFIATEAGFLISDVNSVTQRTTKKRQASTTVSVFIATTRPTVNVNTVVQNYLSNSTRVQNTIQGLTASTITTAPPSTLQNAQIRPTTSAPSSSTRSISSSVM
eukprot:CAMPEP_0168538776 /NCGR_PEP_ID=MMETSP0405-20121227/21395_1 /TAXON_ID=498012 /ORGANISM="Trichosphaerium sp, Strain Am-I-7 wt" /LENGTH=427 /DNA_ID=CAMNT_0008568135 /DNA_START=220 /DNA_END=1500 /DNA_ORIENTATION=+